MATCHRARRAAPMLVALLLALAARATDEAPKPRLPRPGDVIDAENVAAYAHLLPEYAMRWIRDGAWFGEEARPVLPVGETRPAPLPPSYLEATRRHRGEPHLGADGEIEGWTAGLPFPDPEGPELGAKIMWNHYYRWRGDDTVIDSYRTLQTDRWGNRRETRGIFQLLTIKGRTDRPTDDVFLRDRRGIRTASKLIFTWPPESRWQTTLFYRYLDPTRDDAAYVYLPTTRRVLRVQSGQRCAPVRGSDFTPDDFFGFDGRVWEHRWQVVREGKTLAIAHQRHLPPRLDERNAWPVDETWELRDVWVVEGHPRDEGHCYGKRRLWIDKESFQVLHADVWDRSDEFWKGFLSMYAHRTVDDGQAAPVWGGTGAYDFQTRHLTFVTVGESEIGIGYLINGSDLGLADFTPNALLRLGR